MSSPVIPLAVRDAISHGAWKFLYFPVTLGGNLKMGLDLIGSAPGVVD